MTDIHVGNNLLLCNNIGSGYQESQEIVDNASADFGMHACPNGMVMTGIHVGNNLLLCAPPPSAGVSTGRFVDQSGQTIRQGMHACPLGLPMAGIHVGNNLLLCEYRNW